MKIMMRDDVYLNYHIYGKGQPVILLHGFGGIQEIWISQIRWLVKNHYQVITYDQRNHGNSQKLSKSPVVKDLIDDLANIINILKINKPFLIGHSMGANVIYGFLSYHKDIPIKGAIAIDQTPKMLSSKDWDYGYLDVSVDNYKQKLLKKVNIRETLHGLDNEVWKFYHIAKMNKPFDVKNNVDLFVSIALSDRRDSLIHTNVPTLLLSSINSPFFNYRYAFDMANKNNIIEALSIGGAGHDIHAELPNEFNIIMGKFLENHS